jgi:acyl-CoA thioester hydrolase
VVFEHRIRVAAGEIDRMGHVNNVVYVRYVQDAAVAHWRAATTEEERRTTVWVVRRHEIDYLKPAIENDEIVARTWVGEPSGATMDRFVEIRRVSDDELLASARTVWVAVDPKSHRPVRVTRQIWSPFQEPEADES